MKDPSQLIESIRPTLDEFARVESLLIALRPHSKLPVQPRRFFALRALLPEAAPPLPALPDRLEAEKRRLQLLGRANELDTPQRYVVQRALAILYWQWAAADTVQHLSDHTRFCYRAASRLWNDLFLDPGFWVHFASRHHVAAEHLPEIRAQIRDDLLLHHLDRAKTCLLAEDGSGCQFHLRCLSAWELSPESSDARPSSTSSSRTELHAEMQTRATVLRNSWVSDVLRQATRQEKDVRVLQRLPKGISRDFDGILRRVQPLLETLPDDPRLLSFSVEQCLEYASQLELAERYEPGRRLARKGAYLARRLAEGNLREHDSAHADNRIVCNAFVVAANLETDPKKRIIWLEQHQRWGDDDPQIHAHLLQLKAVASFDEDRYDDALRILEQLDTAIPGMVELQAECHYHRAHQKLESGQERLEQFASNTALAIGALHNPAGQSQGELGEIRQLIAEAHADTLRAAQLQPERQTYARQADQLNQYREHLSIQIALLAAQHLKPDGRSRNPEIEAQHAKLADILVQWSEAGRIPESARRQTALLLVQAAQGAVFRRHLPQAISYLRCAASLAPDEAEIQAFLSQLQTVQ